MAHCSDNTQNPRWLLARQCSSTDDNKHWLLSQWHQPPPPPVKGDLGHAALWSYLTGLCCTQCAPWRRLPVKNSTADTTQPPLLLQQRLPWWLVVT